MWRSALGDLGSWWLLPEHQLAAPLLPVSGTLAKSWGCPTGRITNLMFPGSMLACCMVAAGSDAQLWEEQSG